jgi:hypothetical protein
VALYGSNVTGVTSGCVVVLHAEKTKSMQQTALLINDIVVVIC